MENNKEICDGLSEICSMLAEYTKDKIRFELSINKKQTYTETEVKEFEDDAYRRGFENGFNSGHEQGKEEVIKMFNEKLRVFEWNVKNCWKKTTNPKLQTLREINQIKQSITSQNKTPQTKPLGDTHLLDGRATPCNDTVPSTNSRDGSLGEDKTGESLRAKGCGKDPIADVNMFRCGTYFCGAIILCDDCKSRLEAKE